MQAAITESQEGFPMSTARQQQALTVPYSPAYARIAGSVVAGLLLARAVQLQKEAEARGATSWKRPAVRWYRELNISRAQLENAARKVEAAGFITSTIKGAPPTKHYRVDLNAVDQALQDQV